MIRRLAQTLAAVLVLSVLLDGSGSQAWARETTVAGHPQMALAAAEFDRFVTDVVTDVDALWVATFAATGDEYVSPSYLLFDQTVDTGCGAFAPGEVGPFYCPLDETVYLDVWFLTQVADAYGTAAVAYAVAHEWGHHVQRQSGIDRKRVSASLTGVTSVELELMADCLAGAWTAVGEADGLLVPGAIETMIITAAQLLGDAVDAPVHHDTAHGTGALRTWWLLQGYYNGSTACFS